MKIFYGRFSFLILYYMCEILKFYLRILVFTVSIAFTTRLAASDFHVVGILITLTNTSPVGAIPQLNIAIRLMIIIAETYKIFLIAFCKIIVHQLLFFKIA